MSDLTSNNIVDTLANLVKHYPKEPLYYIYVSNSLCIYEIYVNDVPVRKQYAYVQLANPIYINQEILKSGRQKISFKIFPAPPEFNSSGDVFSPNTSFEVDVRVQDYKDPKAGDNDSIVAKYNLPTKIRLAGTNNNLEIQEFEAEGQKYYEGSFYFDATVPYENEGWSNGQDLRKLDQKALEKKVIELYKKNKKIYDEENKDLLANMKFPIMSIAAISEYQNKNKIAEVWSEHLKMLNVNKEWLPMDQYKMVFYGDGRIVSLEQKNETDLRLRGRSLFYFKYKSDSGSTIGRYMSLYFYLQTGKNIDELQII